MVQARSIDKWTTWGRRLVGRTLAHYRISTVIGAGGMGEVYRARDTRLERTVAIKILPLSPMTEQDVSVGTFLTLRLERA